MKFTKEELLSKGIDDKLADEIIAGYQEDAEDDSLQALKKAIPDQPSDDLFKAKKGGDGQEGKEKEPEDDDEEEKGYNPSYMKKHMKRYMKENEAEFEGELKKCFGKMQKAAEIDEDIDGAVVNLADLSPYLESQVEVTDQMCKAIVDNASKISVIETTLEKAMDIIQKSARVQVEQAESLNKFLETSPTGGPKGQVFNEKMKKAVEDKRTQDMTIYSALFKATLNGNSKAGSIVSILDSVGKDSSKLNPAQLAYAQELIRKEAN